jgi:DNA-binding NtrC family response regulator
LQSVLGPLIAFDFERSSLGNWKVNEASDCSEALALLRGQSVPVLLCERDHADGNWEDLLKATARLPAPPKLIVFSRLADASLWAQVLNLGGFDVLMTPFEPEEVLRVTFAAWSRWERDFVPSTTKEAEAADRAIAAAGKRCHTARPDGRVSSRFGSTESW